MNWILLSPPPLSSDADTPPPQNLERAPEANAGDSRRGLHSPYLPIKLATTVTFYVIICFRNVNNLS